MSDVRVSERVEWPHCEGCGAPNVGELCDDCIALIKRERDDAFRNTATPRFPVPEEGGR